MSISGGISYYRYMTFREVKFIEYDAQRFPTDNSYGERGLIVDKNGTEAILYFDDGCCGEYDGPTKSWSDGFRITFKDPYLVLKWSLIGGSILSGIILSIAIFFNCDLFFCRKYVTLDDARKVYLRNDEHIKGCCTTGIFLLGTLVSIYVGIYYSKYYKKTICNKFASYSDKPYYDVYFPLDSVITDNGKYKLSSGTYLPDLLPQSCWIGDNYATFYNPGTISYFYLMFIILATISLGIHYVNIRICSMIEKYSTEEEFKKQNDINQYVVSDVPYTLLNVTTEPVDAQVIQPLYPIIS